MDIGVFGMNSGSCADPSVAIDAARAAEELGYESLWVGEHVVLPDPRVPPSPLAPGAAMLDPIVALSHLAGVTERVRLGTGIIILPQRNPVVTAKEIATLDHLAGGGRVLLGIGVGWLAEEFATLGVPFEDRGPRTDEYVAAMRALWSQERASFAGRFVSFREVFCRPRPADGRIPIVVGGDTRAAAGRAGRLGDGYFPARVASDELLNEMRRAAVEAGRDPADIEITVSAPTEPEAIEALARRGVKRVAVPVSSAAGLPAQVRTPDDVLRYGKTMIERFGE